MDKNYGDQVVTVKEWLVTSLLLMIPVVNIVLMFVWAFSGNEKESKSNFFKASLIMVVIIFVLQVLILMAFGGAMFSLFR